MSTYTLHITKSCNLACDYCYEKDKTSQYSLEQIIKNIDNIFENIKEKITIEFLGGETLLRFDLLKNSIEYMEDKYKQHINNYLITTNGTILNDTIINFLRINKGRISFSISIDGDEESNKRRFYKNGKYCYNDIINNIYKIIDLDPIVHIVTHKNNVCKTYNNIMMFYNMGIKKISIGFIQSIEFLTDEEFEILKKQLIEIIDYRFNNNIKDLYIDIIDSKPIQNTAKIYVKDIINNKIIFESFGSISSGLIENVNKNFSNKNNYQLMITINKDSYILNINNLKNILYNYKEVKYGSTRK